MVPICLLTYDERASPRAHRRFSGTDTAAFRDALARVPVPPACAAHGHQIGAFFPKFTKGEQGEMPKLKDRGSGGLPTDE